MRFSGIRCTHVVPVWKDPCNRARRDRTKACSRNGAR